MRGYAIRRGASWRYSRVSSGGIEAKATLIPSRHGFPLPSRSALVPSRDTSQWMGGYGGGTVFEAGCLSAAVAVVLTVTVDVPSEPRCVCKETPSVVQTCSSSSSSPNFPTAQVETWRRSGHLDTAGNDWKKASLRLKNVSFLRFCCVPLDRSRNTERAEPSAVACASDSGQCAAHALKV